MDITDLPAHKLSDAIRERQVSCREVMRATLARIEAVNPEHNAIVSLRDGEALLHEADERDAQRKWPLPTPSCRGSHWSVHGRGSRQPDSASLCPPAADRPAQFEVRALHA
jgi:hypothetical protein